MCGIAVVINGDLSECETMTKAIKSRGSEHPNYTEVDNIIVGFIRLPITDENAPSLFEYKGHRVWLNGFISNYKELAQQYKIDLDTNCDTELLLKFLYKFGFEKIKELNGFFSIVYYDGRIHFFTDRYGIKQLYRYTDGQKTYVCSEPKGILSVVNLPYNPKAIEDWRYSLGVMTTNTIWEGIERVSSLPFLKPNKINPSYKEAKKQLKKLWIKSIERNWHECAGVMLSGGVDSGLIAKDFKPSYSFSMDYKCDLSEIESIKINSTGKHYTLIHNDGTIKAFAPQTKKALDDLKAGSCYTNFALMELASKFCKVVYSGAGGDEIFNGYTHRYNKDINEVIKRTDKKGVEYNITHKEYDWLFLKALLVVEDRMGGANTIETRYPFLDNDFVDYALSLPDEFLNNKKILKDISRLPKEIIEGKKKGFSNPMSNKEWIEFCLK